MASCCAVDDDITADAAAKDCEIRSPRAGWRWGWPVAKGREELEYFAVHGWR